MLSVRSLIARLSFLRTKHWGHKRSIRARASVAATMRSQLSPSISLVGDLAPGWWRPMPALRPDGDYAYAAIIHDFLYWQQAVPKDTADLIFKMSMEDFQLSRATVSELYHAVSSFGNTAWKKNYDDKNKRGEKRILRQFPSDAKTTWEQWKRRGDVFA